MSRALISPEARVLLLALRPDGQQDRLTAALQEARFNWNRLVFLAQKENATSVLWSVLRALPADLPAERALQLSRLAQIAEFRMQYLEQRLLQTLDTLSAANIDVVLLKGAALASTVYGSFAARPMGDLDLLVRAEDATRAWELMHHSGWIPPESNEMDEFYATHHHLAALEDANPTGIGLELHTDIVPTRRAAYLSAQSIWERAQPVELKGRHTLVPCTEHQVLHIAIHFAWSNMMTSAAWRSFRDLQQIAATSTVDWGELVRLAVQSRARTCCYRTLRLAKSLTEFPVPDEVLRALRPALPEPMLRLLERHYFGSLFVLNPAACPSVRLVELLWTAGIAPRWSGHTHVRPWQRSEAWRRKNQTQRHSEARMTETSSTTDMTVRPRHGQVRESVRAPSGHRFRSGCGNIMRTCSRGPATSARCWPRFDPTAANHPSGPRNHALSPPASSKLALSQQ